MDIPHSYETCEKDVLIEYLIMYSNKKKMSNGWEEKLDSYSWSNYRSVAQW